MRGLCKTSICSIFTFIKDNNLKFCTRSYSSCVYRMMRFKGSNGKVCKIMTSYFRTLWRAYYEFRRMNTGTNVYVIEEKVRYKPRTNF